MAKVEDVRSLDGAEGVDDWIVLVEELLGMKKEENIDKRQRIFFPIPKPLLDSSEQFYIPDLVSIGPRHFGKQNLRLELHKVEAMRRMESRIQNMCPQRTLKSIVEGEIMAKEKWIRDCYEEEIPYTSKQLAWMVTGDACFIYEFILFYCRNVQFMDVEKQWVPSGNYDSIFDSCGMNPMWKRVLFNLLLFENQIPLLVLELLVEIAMGSREALEEKLHKKWLASLISRRSVGIFSWSVSPPSKKGENPHLLGAFYHSVVGDTYLYRCDSDDYQFEDVVKLSCDGFKDFLVPKLPSATELKQKGVKFQCISPRTDFSPIQCVLFDEKTATLWLPQVHVDNFRIALIRNFIALEVTNEMYSPYPMTSFAILMNELIDNGEDCRILREARIIVNMVGSDEEVAKSFNSIMHGMEMRSRTCKSIDNVRAGLRKYVNKRYKILWVKFYSIYFSGPWKVIGLIALSLLIFLTVVQFSAYFSTCNPSPSLQG